MTCSHLQHFHVSHYHGYCNFLRARYQQVHVGRGRRGGEGRGGGSAGGWTLRYDGSAVITVTFLYLPQRCPCRATSISACGDWQPHRGPSNNPAWTFTISFSSWHVHPSKKILWYQLIFNSLLEWTHNVKKAGWFFFPPSKGKVTEHQSA